MQKHTYHCTVHTARLSGMQRGVHMTHAYKLNKHSLAISSVLSVSRSRPNYFLPDLYRQYRTDCDGRMELTYFLIPPPPIGPPLAAKSQLPISAHSIHECDIIIVPTSSVLIDETEVEDLLLFLLLLGCLFDGIAIRSCL
jgi:hypothetical protein